MNTMRSLIDLVESERVCQTPGANYDITISDDEVGATVHLPDAVSVPDMSDKQSQKYEDALHDALEEIVARMIRELDPESRRHWAQARREDQSDHVVVREAKFGRGRAAAVNLVESERVGEANGRWPRRRQLATIAYRPTEFGDIKGPHQGHELRLMLNGHKPLALLPQPHEYAAFVPFVKDGTFVAKSFRTLNGTTSWAVALPEEAWRIDQLIAVYDEIRRKREMSDDDHRHVGELLGYSARQINRWLAGRPLREAPQAQTPADRLIDEVTTFAQAHSVQIEFRKEGPRKVELSDIAALPRSKGRGTAVMTFLVETARRLGVSVWLEALWQGPGGGYTSGYERPTKAQLRLEGWYARFGFEEIGDRSEPHGLNMRLDP